LFSEQIATGHALSPFSRRAIVARSADPGDDRVSIRESDTHACPFCGWHKTQAIGPVGVTSALMHFRCAACDREWDEAVGEPGAEDDHIEPDREVLP
jgi:rubredoxin